MSAKRKISLWDQLLRPKCLKRGWHIARSELHQDFAEDLYCADVIAVDLEGVVKETINRLETWTYCPRPLLHIEVPKGSLGFRPGTVVSIHDRMILSAVVFLMAKRIDPKLPEAVFSWRLKEPLPKKGPIFKETTIVDFPYLKKKTISQRIDPFEAWYTAWPEFDEKSREAFGEDGFRYLVTSDIAAYFENIQLQILRDQLQKHLPDEQRIINLLFSFLESWAIRTDEERPYLRGIPQGTSISSFLGNVFLLPVDEVFEKLSRKHEIKYFRYMDDVRVFVKDITTARLVVFEMIRVLRSLHLNVQTAKTKVLDQKKNQEISRELLDSRVDELSKILEEIKDKFAESPVPIAQRKKYLERLKNIAKARPNDRQPITGSHRPLSGLSMRAFMRWVSCHIRLGSREHIQRLLREIETNPDHRLTRKAIRCSREFPSLNSIQTHLMKFIKSEDCIFPHQRAECLRAIRYLRRIDRDTAKYCREVLYNEKNDPYERVEAAYLLARTELDKKSIKKCMDLLEGERSPYVQVALAGLVVQRRQNNDEIVRTLVFHPNANVREIGGLFRQLKTDPQLAEDRLKHVFREDRDWIVCDNMPFIHLMSVSNNPKVLEVLVSYIKKPSKTLKIVDIREMLKRILGRVSEELKSRESERTG
ncbi:MAG: RNA-directed DNA polymerase [Myxococcota bacterium]|nr:RNA-directed DNA polymerase [Myxococcota bacterium]